ncbi:hypothetical protein OnM2_072014 [Erysiphe neolycopersici]|uniref:Myb-like domain-containing protein n=1 Tax=Erysiphe neolycopersici TaxID=212602 RepID=A0A420HJX5_9PEZI|nr:hypothetical protein OnM2_072014 [Erysiphe neolycopersici]
MQPSRSIHGNYNSVDYSTLPQAGDNLYLYETAISGPNYGMNTDTQNTGNTFGYPEISSRNVELRPTACYYRNDLSDSCMMQTHVSQPVLDTTFRPQYPSSVNSVQNSNFDIDLTNNFTRLRGEQVAPWDDRNHGIGVQALPPGPSLLSTSLTGPNEQFARPISTRDPDSMGHFGMAYHNYNEHEENSAWPEAWPALQTKLPTRPTHYTFTQSQNLISTEAPKNWSLSTSEFAFTEEEPQPSKIKSQWLDGSATPILGLAEQSIDYGQPVLGYTEYARDYSRSLAGRNAMASQQSEIATVRPHAMTKTNSGTSLQARKNIASRVAPRCVSMSSTQLHMVNRRSAKDEFLIQKRRAGMSYKDIRLEGGYTEAESTLRGRFRTLTKPKSARVRKPEWSDKDTDLLRQAVHQLAPRGSGSKIPWKKVAEYIVEHGGSYHFGNSTCRKRWDELQNEQ